MTGLNLVAAILLLCSKMTKNIFSVLSSHGNIIFAPPICNSKWKEELVLPPFFYQIDLGVILKSFFNIVNLNHRNPSEANAKVLPFNIAPKYLRANSKANLLRSYISDNLFVWKSSQCPENEWKTMTSVAQSALCLNLLTLCLLSREYRCIRRIRQCPVYN